MAAPPGIGLDVLEIGRLERALARRPRLAERLFTGEERAYAERRARPGRHLAARFCAKEAVAKALGVTPPRFVEIEIAATGGAPTVRLAGETARRARELGVWPHVSLTHGDAVAAAVCVLVAAGRERSGGAPALAAASSGAAG